MDDVTIRPRIKEIIANATNMDPDEIDDDASFEEGLELDSLSLLEIAVDVDHEFQLNIPDEELAERLANLKTLQDSVNLVKEYTTKNLAGV